MKASFVWLPNYASNFSFWKWEIIIKKIFGPLDLVFYLADTSFPSLSEDTDDDDDDELLPWWLSLQSIIQKIFQLIFIFARIASEELRKIIMVKHCPINVYGMREGKVVCLSITSNFSLSFKAGELIFCI